MSRNSRVSVGNLINHTSQNPGGPVSVQPSQAQAHPVQLPQSPPRVYRYVENGREYYAVNDAIVYPFPCDEDEDDRMDMFHHIIHKTALSGRLHHADLRPRNHRTQVLDLGHATGVWAYEMATQTPHADVTGIDLHSRAPAPIPPGEEGYIANPPCFTTSVDFLQLEWPFPRGSFDLIRMSQLCGSVPDWWLLYQTASSYLRPGIGYIEHIEFDWTPRCVDGNSFPQSATELLQWWRDMQRASQSFGKPMDCPTDIEQIMQRCGFTDTTHRTIQVPLWSRSDDGSEDYDKNDPQAKRENDLCWFFKIPMSNSVATGSRRVPKSFEGLTMSLFTRQLGMQPQAVAALCGRLRAIVCDKTLPVYFNLHVWSARRPRS